MKKIGIILIVVLILIGCTNQEEVNIKQINKQKKQIASLDKEILELVDQKEKLINKITDIKVENGTAKYVITLEIKQQHYFDLGKMIKDQMNAITLQIPVDKECYESLEVGVC